MGTARLSPEQFARALDLQRRCCTQAEIAATLGVHRSTVSRALARHNRRALQLLEKRSASVKGQQIAQLEGLASSLWRAWERSLQDAEQTKTTSEETANTPDGPVSSPTKIETTVKGQSGDAALANQIRGCLADVRKILGLDAPPSKPRAEEIDDDYEIDLSPQHEAEEDPAQPGDESPA